MISETSRTPPLMLECDDRGTRKTGVNMKRSEKKIEKMGKGRKEWRGNLG